MMQEQQPPSSYYRDTGAPPRGSQEMPPMRQPPSGGMGKKLLGPLAVIGVILAKFKAVLIPILKFLPILLKTGGSMLFMIWVYAMTYGWWFAVGFVLLIFVHECGHLIAAKRLGLKVGAPVFIPFMGAIIALKEAPKNAFIEAQVGIGGPILGSMGAAVCYGIFLATGKPLFAALAYFGFFINLFNLAPIGFLDGGRIVTVLSPWLWLVGAAVIGGLIWYEIAVYHFPNLLLCLVLLLSLPRLFSLFRRKTEEERRYFEATPAQRWGIGLLYFGLAILLTLGIRQTLFDPRPAENPDTTEQTDAR